MARLTKKMVDGATGPDVTSRKDRKRWKWYGDDEVPGLGLRVYGSGRKVYALRYRTTRGRERTLRLGTPGELTPQQARKKAREEKVRILNGEDPQREREEARAAEGITTVRKLMERWLEDYAKVHRRSWRVDKYRIEGRIIPDLGRLGVEDVTPARLDRWHRDIGRETPVEANRAVETLRAAWRWAEDQGLLPKDAPDASLFRGGKRARVRRFRERSRDRWLRPEETARLMEAVEREEDPFVRAAVPLLLLTGLRKRELFGARWADVDLDRGEIRLSQTKTGEPQTRLLPGPAVAILRTLPRMADSPYVFPSPVDLRGPRDDFKKPWARIREAAGLGDVRIHDLRRTAGSYMAQAGVPLQEIQQVLGHSHPGVTRVYARLASRNEAETKGKRWTRWPIRLAVC